MSTLVAVLPTVISAIFGIFSTVASQLAYRDNQRAERPAYFGGLPIEDDVADKSIRAAGARERAKKRSALYQTMTTSFLVATAFVSLFAGAPSPITAAVALLGVILGIGMPLYRSVRWWREDHRLIARTEYYVMIQQGAKLFSVDEQQRQFTASYPNLSDWL